MEAAVDSTGYLTQIVTLEYPEPDSHSAKSLQRVEINYSYGTQEQEIINSLLPVTNVISEENTILKSNLPKTKEHNLNITDSGRIIPEKIFVQVCKCCENQCYLQFPKHIQKKTFQTFRKLKNYNEQTAFIFHHVKVAPVVRHYKKSRELKQRNYSRQYFLPNREGNNVSVCKTYFKSILTISDGKIDRILRGKKESHLAIPPKDRRGRQKISEEIIQELSDLILKLDSYKKYMLGCSDAKSDDDGDDKFDNDTLIKEMFREYYGMSSLSSLITETTFRMILLKTIKNHPQAIWSDNRINDLCSTLDYSECEVDSTLIETTSLREHDKSLVTPNEEARKEINVIVVDKHDKSAQNDRKTKGAHGLQFKNITGKIVPGKTFSQVTQCCHQKCFNKLSIKIQERIFKQYYKLGSYDDQNAYIFNHIKVVPCMRHYKTKERNYKNNTRQYFLPDAKGNKSVCKQFFKTILSTSDGRIDRILKNTAPPRDKRGRRTPGNKTPAEKIKQIQEAIDDYQSTLSTGAGNAGTNSEKMCNIRIVFNHYVHRCQEGGVKHVSESVFRTIFREMRKESTI